MSLILKLFKFIFWLVSTLFKLLWFIIKLLAKPFGRIASATPGAVVGATQSVAKMTADVGSNFTYSDSKFTRVREILRQQAQEYKTLLSENKNTLVDMGIIGGVLVADIMDDAIHVPEEIVSAYQAAFPNLAAEIGFRDALSRYEPGIELQGFLAVVKGKLFELTYLEYLNDGNLPVGYEAVLAQNPTQQGWDLAIVGPDDTVSNTLQLKATDSISYVKEALEKYPDIDVVTTSEIGSQALMHTTSEVITSGISDVDLENIVAEAAKEGVTQPDFQWPVAALILVALSSFTAKDVSFYQKSRGFGNRSAKLFVSYGVAHTIGWICQTNWVMIPAGVGFRWVLQRGKRKREEYNGLNEQIIHNRAIIDRLRKLNNTRQNRSKISLWLGRAFRKFGWR